MTQLDLPYSLPYPYSGQPCVLQVPHFVAGQGLVPEMVGKIIPHLGAGLVFYHASSGSQYHWKYNCPAPVDECVIRLLRGEDIPFVYHYDRRRRTLWKAKTEQFLAAPQEATASRCRCYLAAPCWEKRDKIQEHSRGPRRVLIDAIGSPVFEVPYLQEPVYVLKPERF
jgi:hypothetical protein